MSIQFYRYCGTTIALMAYKGKGFYASSHSRKDAIAKLFALIA